MSTQNPQRDDEISLLDIAVVLAENFWLLLLAPLAVGVITFGLATILPKTYRSETVLRPPTLTLTAPSEETDFVQNSAVLNAAVMVALLNSPHVQLNAAESQSWITEKELGKEKLQSFLRKTVHVNDDKKSNLVVVRTYAHSPLNAQDLNQALIASFLTELQPKGATRKMLEEQIKTARNASAVLNAAIRSIVEVDSQTGEVRADLGKQSSSRPALADLIAQLRETDTQIARLLQLLSPDKESIVLQSPTREENPVSPDSLRLAILGSVLSSLVVTVFVFVRAAIRAAAIDPKACHKINRVRVSVPWYKRPFA